MKTFVQELKNRRVYRVAIAYLVGGSAIVQLAGSVLPIFHAPEWAQQLFVVLVALCFPIALVFAWTFDLRAGAIEKTPSSPGTSPLANRQRLWVLIAVSSFVALSALAGYWFWHPWTIRAQIESAPPAPVIAAKSIASLPFENLS